MSKSLYAIADEVERAIHAAVDRETGEISEEGFALLDALNMKTEVKALSVAAFSKGLRHEAELTKARGQRAQLKIGYGVVVRIDPVAKNGRKLKPTFHAPHPQHLRPVDP